MINIRTLYHVGEAETVREGTWLQSKNSQTATYPPFSASSDIPLHFQPFLELRLDTLATVCEKWHWKGATLSFMKLNTIFKMLLRGAQVKGHAEINNTWVRICKLCWKSATVNGVHFHIVFSTE